MATVELKLTARNTVTLEEEFTKATRVWLTGEGSDQLKVSDFYPDGIDPRTWRITLAEQGSHSAAIAVIDMIPTPGGALRALSVLYSALAVEHDQLLSGLTFHLEY